MAELDRDTLFKKLRSKPENKEQLKLFAVGGNARGRQFFKQHGWDEIGSDKIESKYTSRAAQLYRSMLEKEAAKLVPGVALHQQTSGDFKQELADFKHGFEPMEGHPEQPSAAGDATNGDHGVKEPPSPTGDGAVKVPKPVSALGTKPRPGAKKPGKLGLGVKKLEGKVDGALFEQAPAPEPVKAPEPAPGTAVGGPAAAAAAASAAVAPVGSRFAYDVLNSEPTVKRGKDGHLTLNSGSSDFFSNPLAKQNSMKKSSGGTPEPTGVSTAAPAKLKELSKAKAISSRDFQNQDNQETDYERQQRLSKFSGATSISSADYFGRSESGGMSGPAGPANDLDISAADIVNRLSFQAKQDLAQVSQMAGAAAKKLTGIASKLLNDLGRPM